MKRTIVGLVVILTFALVVPYGLVSAQTDNCSAPVNIATGLYPESRPVIALGPQDSLVVGWGDMGGMGFVSKKSGGPWLAIDGIQGYSAQEIIGSSSSPEIAVSATGTIYAVCEGQLAGEVSFDVFYSSRPADGGWGEPLNISNSAEYSMYSAIAVDSTDTVHIVWSDGGKILYRSSSDGISWSDSVNISQTSEQSVHPSIATDASGNIHVVWKQSPFQIFYAMKPAGGAWSTPKNISNTAISRQLVEPDICVDSSGTVHVVASTSNTGTPEVLYIKKQYGSWLQPVEIGNYSGYSGYINGVAKLAADNQGNVHVVWSVSTAETYEVLYAHKPGVQPWLTPIKLSSYAYSPDVVTDSTGGVHIVWYGGIRRIFYTSTPCSPAPTPDTGTVTGTVVSTPAPSGAANEYNLYLELTSTHKTVWCAATTTDFPDLLTWGVTVTGTLNNSLGWWVLRPASPTPAPTPITVNITGTVASVPAPSGATNEYNLYLKVTGTGERVWCAATTTDFPNLLTVGATITGALNNSLGWWVFKK